MKRQVINTLLILALGIFLGLFSKYLDNSSSLPWLAQKLDLANFLIRLTVWLIIAMCISVFSSTPKRAAVNVSAFFAGMVSAYYMYSEFIAGFFPMHYAMIWAALTAVSPFLAYICWYAKGTGRTAAIISSLIVGTAGWTTVHIGMGYISVTSILDVIMLVISIAVLWRNAVKQSLVMLWLGVLSLMVLQFVMPFGF